MMRNAVLGLAIVLSACATRTLSERYPLAHSWPSGDSLERLTPPLSAEAAQAEQAAIAYVGGLPEHKDLFDGCPPDKALTAMTFKDGPIHVVRVSQTGACPNKPIILDWFEVYAVSADGKILAKRPEEDPPQ
jgi:hypothetical protein